MVLNDSQAAAGSVQIDHHHYQDKWTELLLHQNPTCCQQQGIIVKVTHLLLACYPQSQGPPDYAAVIGFLQTFYVLTRLEESTMRCLVPSG